MLNTGDADGLGEIRKKELVKSGVQLGLRSEDDVYVHEDPSVDPSAATKMAVLIIITATFQTP